MAEGEIRPQPDEVNEPPQAALPQIPEGRERKERDGLRLNFAIDNQNLIASTLLDAQSKKFSSKKHGKAIVALQNIAWRQSQLCYDFLTRRIERLPTGTSPPVSSEELTQFFNQVEQSNEFRTVRQQTERYMHALREQWEKNYPLASQAMQEMTGLDFNKEMTVMVTHPSLSQGRYLGNDTITFGHHEDWKNYSTIYLWHEALHSYFDPDGTSHALIQLITDNELRTRLNEGTTYPPFEGHEDLFPLMAKIEPHWRSYLEEARSKGKGDIQAFQAKIQSLPEMTEQTAQQTTQTGIE